MTLENVVPSNKSKQLASDIVEIAVLDAVFDNTEIMTARISEALEKSWLQGLDDAELARRVYVLRGAR